MFGNNPVRKSMQQEPNLRVQEIFATIQGEGPFAGTPAVFLRLAGCNLRCTFCDTDFESNFDNVMAPIEVAKKVMELAGDGIRLLVITGGEPMLQNFLPILRLLNSHSWPYANGWKFQVETAGTVWLPGIEQYEVSIVCSPKTPTVHSRISAHAAAWKYIIRAADYEGASLEDDLTGLPCKATQPGVTKNSPLFHIPEMTFQSPDRIYLQPCDEGPEQTPKNVKLAIALCMQHGYKLCIQQHKLVGLP